MAQAAAGTPLEILPGAGTRQRAYYATVWVNFRHHRVALIGLAVVALVVLACVAAPVIAPHDPYVQNLALTRTGKPQPPSLNHLWGTDQLGRDYLSRALYAGRISLSVGFFAVAVSMGLGIVLGSVAGFSTGAVDMILMRITDVALSFPPLIVLLALASILRRPTVFEILLIIGLLGWMTPTRLVRAECLSLKQREFVLAARASGCSDLRIMVRHLLPNALGPVLVAATLGIPRAILTEATLSFLGLGVQLPTPSWGNMLTPALRFVQQGAWWMAFYPGMLVAVTALAVNFVGDGLRDALDPRLHR